METRSVGLLRHAVQATRLRTSWRCAEQCLPDFWSCPAVRRFHASATPLGRFGSSAPGQRAPQRACPLRERSAERSQDGTRFSRGGAAGVVGWRGLRRRRGGDGMAEAAAFSSRQQRGSGLVSVLSSDLA